MPPDDFTCIERLSAARQLAASAVLAQVSNVVEGPLLLYKGPQAAAAYLDPAARDYEDLDLIVPDAARVQRALIASGFVEIGDPALYRDIHHLRPLTWPGLPLPIEIHSRVKWPALLRSPPTFDDLIEQSTQAAPGVAGVMAPSPEHHALLLSAHAWAHAPLRRVRDLVDIGAATAIADGGGIEREARRWELERIWRTTRAAVGSLFLGEARPLSLRTWARHLVELREPTVLEWHLQRDFSSFWAVPAEQALGASARELMAELRPAQGDRWREKLVRIRTAFGNATLSRFEHERVLGEMARRPSDRANRPKAD